MEFPYVHTKLLFEGDQSQSTLHIRDRVVAGRDDYIVCEFMNFSLDIKISQAEQIAKNDGRRWNLLHCSNTYC